MPYFQILRPFNCLFVAVSVLFGAFYLNPDAQLNPVFFAVLSAVFIAAGGYVINDFFDLPIDAVNKPKRVLPAGKIVPKTAYLYAVALFLAGILASCFTRNMICLAMATLNSIALFYYARYFKMSFITGNIIVAYAAGSTFIYGGLAADNVKNSLIIATYAFLYTLIREFIKDAEDIEGDMKFGAGTLAVKLGRKNTVFVAMLPASAVIIFTFLMRSFLNGLTFWLLHLMVSLPLIIFLIMLLAKTEKKRFYKMSNFMKLDMLILLIILWIGK